MAQLISEELVLLAFDPENGGLRASRGARLDAAVACGLIVEAQLLGGVTIDEGRVLAGELTGDPLLDEIVSRIRARRRLLNLEQWVVDLAGRQFRARAAVLRRLVDAGLVSHRRERFAGLIPYDSYGLADAAARTRVDARVRAVLIRGRPSDDRTAILIALLSGAGL